MSKAGVKVVEYPTGSEEYERIMAAQSERYREVELLRLNTRTYQSHIGAHEKHIAILKKQIVDLQAQLLASQDRITELQRQLLESAPGNCRQGLIGPARAKFGNRPRSGCGD